MFGNTNFLDIYVQFLQKQLNRGFAGESFILLMECNSELCLFDEGCMMFPRRSSLSRLVFIGSGLIFCIWIWQLQPQAHTRNQLDSDVQINHVTIFSQVQEVLDKSHEALLTNGTKSQSEDKVHDISELSIKGSSNEHQNQTRLERLKHNMTMLKANMSGVGQILHDMNQTVNHTRLDLPNPHPFHYIINTESVCHDDLFLLAYIHTAPDHYKRRMVIRQTWGNPKYYDKGTLRVVFIMGKTSNKGIQESLDFEAEQYHDIVQEDFVDAYKNLTYKGITALKWISMHCRKAKFILKADDDIFVNTFTLIRHLQSMDEAHGLLMCLVWGRMKVMREGKWKVSKEDFKEDYYPTYCSGSAYTMSTDVAIALHNISYHVPFFWVDDFYITGLLPLKLGNIKHKQFMSTYVLDGRKLKDKFTGSQWFTYIFSHVHDLNAITSVWDQLVKLAKGDVRPAVKFALPGQLPNEAEIFAKQKQLEEEKARKRKEEEEAKKKAEEAKKKAQDDKKKAQDEKKEGKIK